MPRRLYIPAQVIEDITRHINEAVLLGVEGFWSASEDEDSLTGHVGACLKTGTHTVNVTQDEIPGPWKWSINYTKFRGRGKNATESYLGADGIFELTLDRGFSKDTKSTRGAFRNFGWFGFHRIGSNPPISYAIGEILG